MSETALGVLKGCFIALLYLFLLRVVMVVASELKGTPAPSAAPPPPEPARAPEVTKKRLWTLTILEPEGTRGESHQVAGELSIGRGGGCAIVLAADTFVSTVHARVFERDGAVWVEDLKSTNGTLVNGTRIDAATKLKRGDRIQVGSTLFEAAR